MTSPSVPTGRTAAVILAAGLGTRMRSRLPKVLHALCGRPMVAYVIDAWTEAASEDDDPSPIIVHSPPTAALLESPLPGNPVHALQAEPRGTADAVRAAIDTIPASATEVMVLSGDVPLIEAAQLRAVIEQRRLDDAAIALASVFSAAPGELGRVVRSEFGTVERIVEARDATGEELEGNEVNAGVYCFDAAWLRRRIGAVTPSEATGEFYLTELVRLAREDGRIVSAVGFDDDGTFDGINDRAQLAQAEWALRVRRNEAHMRAGVTMRDPSTVYCDWMVELAADVTIEPNTILRGRTTVAAGSTIGPGTTLVDAVIGPDCLVWASVVESSELESGVRVGPFSHIRPGSRVGAGAEIGNFAELKNARLGTGVKQHHVSYLGDATLGDRTNVGAGTITANWDGRTKHRTTVGREAFLGVDTMLVAPIEVGDGARTGAGAVVTKPVPPGMLAVGVPARMRTPRPRDPEPTAAETTPPVDESGDTSAGQPRTAP